MKRAMHEQATGAQWFRTARALLLVLATIFLIIYFGWIVREAGG